MKRNHTFAARTSAINRCLLTVALLVLSSAAVAAPAYVTKEHRVKAAWLYQFAKFIEWPEIPGDEITIGILGDEPFAGALDTIRNKTVKGKPLEIRLNPSTRVELADLQILFVGSNRAGELEAARAQLRCWSVLIVTDTPGLLEQGGMINFVRVGFKQKFEINLDALATAQLQISPQLLKVATRVKESDDH